MPLRRWLRRSDIVWWRWYRHWSEFSWSVFVFRRFRPRHTKIIMLNKSQLEFLSVILTTHTHRVGDCRHTEPHSWVRSHLCVVPLKPTEDFTQQIFTVLTFVPSCPTAWVTLLPLRRRLVGCKCVFSCHAQSRHLGNYDFKWIRFLKCQNSLFSQIGVGRGCTYIVYYLNNKWINRK